MDVGKAPVGFSHIQLRNWKNFAACEVELANRVFLVGPNAAGKSNFLDAFRFVRDLASAGGGFQEAIRRRGGVSAIRSLAARRYPDVELRVLVRAPQSSWRWEYHVGFNQDKQRRARITKEYLRQKIAGYNNAARRSPWIVLVDLDREQECHRHC